MALKRYRGSNVRTDHHRRLLAVLAMLAFATGATASPLAPDVASCRPIKDAAARLKCFDALSAEATKDVGKAIADWSGSGMTTTRPFHADGPFEIEWDASGFFQTMLDRVGGGETIIANQIEGGPGSSYVPEGGDYYLKVSAMARWHARAVALPPGKAPESADLSQSGEESQADLPPCDGPNADDEVRDLVQNSPLGQAGHIRVLDVGPITKTTSPKGVEVCHTKLITSGGEEDYDFQNIRRNGSIFITGRPR